MIAVTPTAVANLIVALATAVGVLLTGIGTIRANRKADALHETIKTSNGTPTGQMIENTAKDVAAIVKEVSHDASPSSTGPVGHAG